MIQMVVSDFDGTLVGKGAEIRKGINERDREAIREFTGRGGLFVIATGRHPAFILEHFVKGLDVYAVVGYSGGITSQNGKLSGINFTNTEIAAFEAFRKAHKGIFDMFICSWENNYYFTGKDSFAYGRKSRTSKNGMVDYNRLEDLTIGQLLSVRNADENKICRIVLSFPDAGNMPAIQDDFKKEFGDLFHTIPTGPVQFEILEKSYDKASGVLRLASEKGIPNGAIAAIGDDKNDIAMFRAFSRSFCMENADESVKGHAAATTDSVARAIQLLMK